MSAAVAGRNTPAGYPGKASAPGDALTAYCSTSQLRRRQVPRSRTSPLVAPRCARDSSSDQRQPLEVTTLRSARSGRQQSSARTSTANRAGRCGPGAVPERNKVPACSPSHCLPRSRPAHCPVYDPRHARSLAGSGGPRVPVPHLGDVISLLARMVAWMCFWLAAQ